ncbi:ISAs1 family transposase [Paraglaciecola sp.]|uniref:ISAs1 family transposase n=1 Tax=Paraglaciecola sp. TaxID=1920173 RepID=UPI0030F433C5
MNTDIFSQHFGQLVDPRQSSKIQYPLFDIVFLTVTATIAGCHRWEDIEYFAEVHEQWLRNKNLFSDGLPAHDTIARVVSSITPSAFQQVFQGWMKSVCEATQGEVIVIFTAKMTHR